MLTTIEACRRLKVSRRTLERYVQAGRINRVRLTVRAVRYYPDEIDRLLGVDDGTEAIILAAQSRLAEQWAQDERPMCTGCGRRRAPRTGSLCQDCAETAALDRQHKRDWWARNQPKRITIDGKRVYVKQNDKEKAS